MAGKTATLPATAVEPELRDALNEIAAAQEVSLGHVIRQACKAYVEAGRKPSADTAPAATFRPARNAEPCQHPKTRINKGLCGACGTNVTTGA